MKSSTSEWVPSSENSHAMCLHLTQAHLVCSLCTSPAPAANKASCSAGLQPVPLSS